MDSQLAHFVASYYGRLMTPAERLAHRHLIATYKATGRSDVAAQAEARAHRLHSRWQTDAASQPLADRRPRSARPRAREGMDAFLARVAERVLREHAEEVFLNHCPRCGGLTRTPKAQLCLHCGHDWHPAPAGGEEGR